MKSRCSRRGRCLFIIKIPAERGGIRAALGRRKCSLYILPYNIDRGGEYKVGTLHTIRSRACFHQEVTSTHQKKVLHCRNQEWQALQYQQHLLDVPGRVPRRHHPSLPPSPPPLALTELKSKATEVQHYPVTWTTTVHIRPRLSPNIDG